MQRPSQTESIQRYSGEFSDLNLLQKNPTNQKKFFPPQKKIAKHDQSKELLESWLNKVLKIQITDGRVLIGTFLCTDRDLNIILGSCLEYVNEDKGKYCSFSLRIAAASFQSSDLKRSKPFSLSPNPQTDSTEEEPRSLGLVMVPGKHVLSISVDVQTDDV